MRLTPLFAAAALAVTSPAFADGHGGHSLENVLGADVRADDVARDQYRNPAQTLTFFGVEPGMSVVDFMPSSGWYTRILVPFLGDEGIYIGMNPDVTGAPDFFQRMANYDETLPGQVSEVFGETGATPVGVNVNEVPESMHGTVDRFLIFREIHNIRRFGWLHDTLVTARTVLKDDGLVGVVQHRADADAPASYVLGDNGYQREQDVIGLFEAYGFELVARSEINANPADPADWERGVWSLPPVFGGAPEGSEERARRAEIGESDRMTLLFRKRG